VLSETLTRIMQEFPAAREQPFARHPLAIFVRTGAVEAVTAALGELAPGLVVKGSAGAGNWADVPWLAVFDPVITGSATRGYYLVYLFS
jgi:5-methylcytosine-specific restriction protein A